ncbi:MAG: response regulator [Bacteriovoracaceae bacterium]|jgi:two-component system, chemotaxis family, chemotaxis protein CheY|nr:response regulator [Bacteriovoracaceae bacterium]
MKKVLLVDDSSVVRERIRTIISKNHKVHVLEACNGIEGLKVIEGNKDISLMFVDVNMPEMDGITMLKRLHNDFSLPEANIVMLTTEATKELKTQARENGAKAWVLKPVSEDKVNMIFKKLL